MCLEQFGKGMSRCLEVSYNGFRHLWLGSACKSELAREKLKDAVFFLVHRLAVDQIISTQSARNDHRPAGLLTHRSKIASNPR